MKRSIILLLFALMAIILFGCQPEKEAVEAEEVMSETEGKKIEGLLGKDGIVKMELSETKGVDPVVYEAAGELEIFRDIFSSADKEPGIVNMSDPEFYLKVVMENGEKRYLNLWLGGEGDMASLMNIEDTHTIYTVTPDVKRKLIELMRE